MFHFKLDFLLRYRRQKEETAMLALAQKVRELNQVDAELTDVREQQVQIAEGARQIASRGVAAPIFMMYKDYQMQLIIDERNIRRKMVRAEAQVQKQRQILVAASTERKIMDRLKEKQKEKYQEQEANREQKGIEELNALVQSRKKNDQSA